MLDFYGQTDIGQRRAINQDTICAEDGFFLVCDGMGGHKAGEVASRLAADVVLEFLRSSSEASGITWPYGYDRARSPEANRLRTAIKLANRVVFGKAGSSDEYTDMGTTVAAVLVHPTQPLMTYAHVGDSRIYLIRSGSILQLTRDDTWANLEWPSRVEGSRIGSMKNVLTKALGARDDVDFDVIDYPLRDKDVVLLCSDGLTNMLSDREILETVCASSGELRSGCKELVSKANAQGGRDNISAILLSYST
jgi:protein phosphatase